MADLPSHPGGAGGRRGYLDWLRGVAVLIMIEGHLADGWVAPAGRETTAFGWAIILGGFGAPLFLFLAGVAVSMSAGSKARRLGSVRSATFAVARRGAEIFLLAFLFRIQAWLVSGGSVAGLLKVDILNVMGPSIIGAALLWGMAPSGRARRAVLGLATLGVALLTPTLRNAPLVVALPDPLEAYVRPVPGMSNFVFLPWAGFLFAGALLGTLVDAARDSSSERRLALACGFGGLALAATAFALSYLPGPFGPSYFWTSSPAYFFLRLGLLTAAVGGAFAWERRPGGALKWSPLRQLGRTSLFVYWIHVELIYGAFSAPLHRALTGAQAVLAYVLFSGAMLACSLLKDQAVAAWRDRAETATGGQSP